MKMSNALDTGGGRHEEMYEKTGLRNSGTGICKGSTTFAMTGCAGGEVRRGGCRVQQVAWLAGRGKPHATPTLVRFGGSVSNSIQRHRPGTGVQG